MTHYWYPSCIRGNPLLRNRANRILGRQGRFWQEEYFDYLVRSDKQFAFYVHYILENPVKAGLCKHWQDWPWSGCSDEIRSWLSEIEAGGQDARARALASVQHQRGESSLRVGPLRPVAESNCAAARQSGEQQEENDQPAGDELDSAA